MRLPPDTMLHPWWLPISISGAKQGSVDHMRPESNQNHLPIYAKYRLLQSSTLYTPDTPSPTPPYPPCLVPQPCYITGLIPPSSFQSSSLYVILGERESSLSGAFNENLLDLRQPTHHGHNPEGIQHVH